MPPGFRLESTEANAGNVVEEDTGRRINSATGKLEIRGSYGNWYEVDLETGSPKSDNIQPCYNID